MIATVSLCNQMGYSQVIFDCESTFLLIKDDIKGMKKGPPVIDLGKVEVVIRLINEFVVAN